MTLLSPRVERRLGWDTEDRLAVPTECDAAQAIAAGLCPICGAGPFTVVATHASKKHGIDRRMFRDLAGIPYSASICDPAHAKACRQRAQQHGLRPLTTSQRGRPKANKSVAWRRRQQAAAAAGREARTREALARRADLVRQFNDGASLRYIAASEGISQRRARDLVTQGLAGVTGKRTSQ